ncbi:MAG: DUF937 domain-containing protein [Janthinobacterium lividum]
MSQTLLELAQNYFAGEPTRQASKALGETESNIGTALRSIIPLVIGSLFNRSQQPGGAAELLGLAQQAHSSGILSNLSSLLGGLSSGTTTTATADGGLLNRGTEMLRSVLGTQYAPAVTGVSQQAGISSSSAGSLLSMAVPVVLGLLGKHTATNNLNASSFGSYLGDQRSSLLTMVSSLPGSIGTILGGLGLGSAATSLGNTVSAATNRTENTVRTAAREVEKATPNRWPWILLALLALGALLYFMRGCNKTTTDTAVDTTMATDTTRTMTAKTTTALAAPTGHYDTASDNYIYDIGDSSEIKLPDGTVLNVGNSSSEARLFNFLNDKDQLVSDDKTQGWISLDRVYFNTGKATLTTESAAQLKNIAAILKAFPEATLKLGGYTDNKGAAAMNVTLSADRANTALKSVMKDGLVAGRAVAEGYGQEHPIATNDTPDGRAQNRRVDVRVTKK